MVFLSTLDSNPSYSGCTHYRLLTQTTYQTLRGWKMTLTDSLPNLLLFREHDQLLGDVLTPHTSALTPSELLLVKQVRMFAGYTTLSDIVTADGLCIRKEAWDLSESRDSYCLHPYNWPSTPPRLTAKHKQVWQLGLAQALLQSHTVLRRLQRPLGQWQRTPHTVGRGATTSS